MLAALHVLSYLGHQPTGSKLSELLSEFARYSMSGEINTTVADAQASIAAVRAQYESLDGITIDTLDGMTVNAKDWWFNFATIEH